MCCQFLWNFPAVLWNKLEFLISRAPLLPVLSFCHPPLKPCPLSPRLSPSFIQFNFKLYTGRQAKRVAPWLPGTKPSHYTANWFWPAAMSATLAASPTPHTSHHLCTPDCLRQRSVRNTEKGMRKAASLRAHQTPLAGRSTAAQSNLILYFSGVHNK